MFVYAVDFRLELFQYFIGRKAFGAFRIRVYAGGQLYVVGGCTAGGPVNEDILYQRDRADFSSSFRGNLLAVLKTMEVFLRPVI